MDKPGTARAKDWYGYRNGAAAFGKRARLHQQQNSTSYYRSDHGRLARFSFAEITYNESVGADSPEKSALGEDADL